MNEFLHLAVIVTFVVVMAAGLAAWVALLAVMVLYAIETLIAAIKEGSRGNLRD